MSHTLMQDTHVDWPVRPRVQRSRVVLEEDSPDFFHPTPPQDSWLCLFSTPIAYDTLSLWSPIFLLSSEGSGRISKGKLVGEPI